MSSASIPRVNGLQIRSPEFVGKKVRLVGKKPENRSGVLLAPDNQEIPLILGDKKFPFDTPVVEVIGTVSADGSLKDVERITPFSANFDLEIYNGMLQAMQKHPQIF